MRFYDNYTEAKQWTEENGGLVLFVTCESGKGWLVVYGQTYMYKLDTLGASDTRLFTLDKQGEMSKILDKDEPVDEIFQLRTALQSALDRIHVLESVMEDVECEVHAHATRLWNLERDMAQAEADIRVLDHDVRDLK